MSSNNKKFKLLEKPAVYIVTSSDVPNLYKIGLTKNIVSRMRSYHTSIPGNVQIIQICYFNHLNAMKIAEKLLHFTLSNYREQDNKEWFRTENSELFIKMLKKITRFINSIAPEDEDEDEDDEDEEEDDEDDIAEALEDGVDRVTYPPRAPSILPSKRPTRYPPVSRPGPIAVPGAGPGGRRPGTIEYGSDHFHALPLDIQYHYHQIFGNQELIPPGYNPTGFNPPPSGL